MDKLWDIPERTNFHPKGNGGAHTLLVLEAGKDLPACEHHMKGHNFGQMKAAKLYDLNELIPTQDFDLLFNGSDFYL